jgi:hypothetical protein
MLCPRCHEVVRIVCRENGCKWLANCACSFDTEDTVPEWASALACDIDKYILEHDELPRMFAIDLIMKRIHK